MYLDILILATIRDEPRHGYEIKKRVGRVLGLGVNLNNNILYPSLKRFEQEGAVKSKLEVQKGSPSRRVYRLTAKGNELLRSMLEDFSPERAESEPEFLVRLAFFDLVEHEVQMDILNARHQVVESELTHVTAMRKLLDPKQDRYPAALTDFLIESLDREVRWIEGLRKQVGREKSR